MLRHLHPNEIAFICIIGIKIANTTNKMNAPIIMITIGSRRERRTLLLVSISDFINCATFSNINERLPAIYPLEISCIKISGKTDESFNAPIKSLPSLRSLFDWSIIDKSLVNKQFFLSGGLTLENIENAVNTGITNFFDVSSGVESNPGVKDTEKLKKFINFIKH